MGTTWSAKAIAPSDFDARAAEASMQMQLNAIIDQMSGWEPTSLLSQFNALPKGARIALPEHLLIVLERALQVARESDGAFDPTLGALVNLWGFGATTPAADPNAQEIADALANAGWQKLNLKSASLGQPGHLRLDLSGIAKGYAVDELARILSSRGLNSYLVEIGGELRGAGVKPDGQPWWVDIEEPPGSARAPLLLALFDLAIATSGDYQRFGQSGGARIAHTLDPRTGRPLLTSPASVSVLHQSCMLADAYATALMVMGPIQGVAFAASKNLAARFVATAEFDYAETLSPALIEMLEDA